MAVFDRTAALRAGWRPFDDVMRELGRTDPRFRFDYCYESDTVPEGFRIVKFVAPEVR